MQICVYVRLPLYLISHPSKVIVKTILNRLKPQAEKIFAEEQTGFRAGRSTTEQIFNQRILGEKYLQHLQRVPTPNRNSKWQLTFTEEKLISALYPRILTSYKLGLSECLDSFLNHILSNRDSLLAECRTRDRKVKISSPGRNGGRIFFSRINFLCWLLFGVCSTPVSPQWHAKVQLAGHI